MPTPEREHRRGQESQAPPDGVLWYAGHRLNRACPALAPTHRLNRRGLPPSLESFKAVENFADTVLRYKPKPKSEPAKKRRKRAKKIARASASTRD